MSSTKTNVYFPSLNGIRFIAAFLVYIHHYASTNFVSQNINYDMSGFLIPLGGTGVTLFFVLSGFLITYLLLTEFKNEKKINIKDFYIRRMLRIWPLYFFTLGINLLYAYASNTLTPDYFFTRLTLYLFFLPNVASILFMSGGFPMQLWSVGSEEQFYLCWPWLIKYFRKKLKVILISIPILYFILRIMLLFLIHTQAPLYFKGINVFSFMNDFTTNFRVDCMVIGGFFAWLLFNEHRYLQLLFSKKTQYVALSLVVLLILVGFNTPIINYPVYSVLFAIVILNLSSNINSIFNLKHKLFEELGKISYGLYVFHPLILLLTFRYLNVLHFNSSINIPLGFIVSFSLTILISYISFIYLETPFLKFKHKFSVIKSGNDAR